MKKDTILTGIAIVLLAFLSKVYLFDNSNGDSEVKPAMNEVSDSFDPQPFNIYNKERQKYIEIEDTLSRHTAESITVIDKELKHYLDSKEFGVLRQRLLELAAEAVNSGNKPKLAELLSLLGQVSMEEQDLDSAEVYLTEALDIFKELGDEVGIGTTHLQLGRVYLKSRQIARSAGEAYDLLQVARWQLQHGQYNQAEINLRKVISENLSINRFGAAASAYSSLLNIYNQVGDHYQAEVTAMRAAELYAASGLHQQAIGIVNSLKNSGVESWRIEEVVEVIDINYQNFQENIQQIARARDFQQLHYHYRSVGDNKRAWKFRLLAGESLAHISRRAMFRRQPDVLAILYNSNQAMEQAEDYFSLAGKTFQSHGMRDLLDKTEELSLQIF